MKERLEQLIATHGLKHWSFAARKDREFMEWVHDRIPAELRDAPFAQQVYSAVHDDPILCHLGNRKGFDSIERGFRFCGRAGKCPCAAASVSKKCKENIDHEARLAASREGLMRKHGVTNPGQTKHAREQHKAFYADKNKVEEANRKGRATMQERHGVDNALQLLNFDRGDVARRNWTQLAKDILLSKESLEMFMEGKSVATMASLLEVNSTTINNYIRHYDIRREYGSSFENEIAGFLNANGIAFKSRNRSLVKGELDFYIPEANLALEFNGLYWHSDQIVDRNYHLRKYEACRDAGIRLLMINEDEWVDSQEIIKNKILILCNKAIKGVGGRHLVVAPIDIKVARQFTQTHHLQGSPGNMVAAYGAFYNNHLVACITLGRQRTTSLLELSRFCTDGRLYSGVFSKLLSTIRKIHDETIVTFADLRYSDGNLYRVTGFVEDQVIKPDYRYVKRSKSYHKSLFTKARIARLGVDMTNKTEYEAMKEMGYSRIYDCGKIRFLLPK